MPAYKHDAGFAQPCASRVRRLIRGSVNRSRGGNAGRGKLNSPAPFANHEFFNRFPSTFEAIMNTAIPTSANLASGQPLSSSGNKPLWAAVGLLSAAVLAMGGTMLYRQGAQSAVTAAPVAALTAPAASPTAAARTATPLASNDVADDLVEKPAAPVKKVAVKPAPRPAPAPRYAGVSPAPRAAAYPANYPNNYPSNYPSSYPASQPSHQAVNYPPANVCATCGSVESVTAVQRPSKPSPISVGSVAGGVIGAALGSQVGHGNGRTLATVLGAVGGGFAGHAIEGQVRKETVYQVGVRMQDGSRRTIESATAPSVGSRVTVDGNGLQGQSSSYEQRAAPMSVGYTQPSY
jgi:outer membrane lipoprotein SlyB